VIQFIDLKTQYGQLQTEIEDAVLRVLRSGQYILGPEVETLEKKLASYVGVEHVISCASGTDALVMALMAKGIGPGDAVFTIPFTFMASAEAIATVGATPIFVDVDPLTFNIDIKSLRRAIDALQGKDDDYPLPRLTKNELARLKPKGIIAVDLFGQPADYDELNAIATANGLFVLEDAAQSFGSTYNKRPAGGLAEIGCTSFFPAKPLGCYGDGGAIFTNDHDLAEVLRSIRVHGQGHDKYENVRLGLTGRLDAIQAAILNVKFNVFGEEIAARDRIAKHYSEAINAAALGLITPSIDRNKTSAWAQYTVISEGVEARKMFQSRLSTKGIPSMIYYPKPLHLQKAFSWLGHKEGDFLASEGLCNRVFSLPMHPYLTSDMISTIVGALKS
jgi:UDP-2-acetamido-2-deoxy-ribo-hexuluronate aminotransferase